jgi:hypothetical protein
MDYDWMRGRGTYCIQKNVSDMKEKYERVDELMENGDNTQ